MYYFGRAGRIRTLAVIIFAFLLFFASPAHGLTPGPQRINVTSTVRFETPQYVTSSIYNKNLVPHSIGNSVQECHLIPNRRTLPDDARFCHISYRFGKGQIIAAGLILSKFYYRIAVIGGTGIYWNIQGEVTGTTISLGPRTERLRFKLVAVGAQP